MFVRTAHRVRPSPRHQESRKAQSTLAQTRLEARPAVTPAHTPLRMDPPMMICDADNFCQCDPIELVPTQVRSGGAHVLGSQTHGIDIGEQSKTADIEILG